MLIEKLYGIEKKMSLSKEDKLTLKIDKIKDHCNKIAPIYFATYPFFTCHDIRHSEALINIMDQICDLLFLGKNDLSLNRTEIFCLLASCYLHDTGMIHFEDNDQIRANENIEDKDEYNKSVSKLIRSEHHYRTVKYINEHQKELGIDQHFADVIGRISKGHRKVDLSDSIFDNDLIGMDTIRVRILAALLRMADELDLDYNRITQELEIIFNSRQEFDSLSNLHYIKHFFTSGIKIGLQELGNEKIKTINIKIRVPDEKHNRRMKAIIKGPITKAINDTKQFLSEVGIKFKINEIEHSIIPIILNNADNIFAAFYKPYRKNMKILIIDDESFYQTKLKEILSHEPYSIDITDNSETAYSKIMENQYDLILLDIIMRTEDEGIELLKRIKNKINGTVVFMITIRHDAGAANIARDLGAKAYFEKEKFEIQTFRDEVDKVFESRFDIISNR